MRGDEVLLFLYISIGIFVVIILSNFLFRRSRKIVITITLVLVVGFIGFYYYFPTLKEKQHEARFEILTEYLKENYPNQTFDIEPEHYEDGYIVGDFRVNDQETAEIGVTLRVMKDGGVKQVSTWSKVGQLEQRKIYQTLAYSFEDDYSLDKNIPKVEKVDEWIEGELTVFLVMLEDVPAITIFDYSPTSYSLLHVEKAESKSVIYVEEADYVFIYVDEEYPFNEIDVSLSAGDYTFDVQDRKGRLIVEKLN